MERRRHGVLLHALPARRGACGRRPRLLSAGLLPPHRDPDRERRLRHRQGLPEDRRDDARGVAGRSVRPGLGQERRRWRALAVPPHAGRPLDPTRRRRGPGRRGTLRLRRLALSALAPRRLPRPHAVPAGRRSKARRGAPDRGRGRRLHRGLLPDRESDLPPGAPRRPLPHPRRREGRQGDRDAGDSPDVIGLRPRPGRRRLDPVREPERPRASRLVPRDGGWPGLENRTRAPLSRRLRRLRGGPRVGRLEGRNPRARRRSAPQGNEARREQSDAPLRLWRLRHQPEAGLLGHAARLARPGRRLRGRRTARRRRVRRRLARGRQSDAQAERLRRLRGQRAAADRARVHEARPARRSRAAPTAAS